MNLTLRVKELHQGMLSFFFITTLLFSCRVFHKFLLDEEGGTKVFLLIWAVIYITSSTLLILNKKLMRVVKENKELLLIVGITFFSFIWSFNSSVTIYKSITLLGGFLLSACIVYQSQGFLYPATVTKFLQVCAMLSLLAIILFPDISRDNELFTNAWNGIFPHKNYMGRMMALLFVVTLFTSKSITYLSAAATLVLLSTSAGAIFTLVLVSSSTIITKYHFKFKDKSKIIWLSTIFPLIFLFVILIYSNYETLLGLVGKDSTLTGRTELWDLAVHFIMKEIWLGYGFNAFWFGESSVGNLMFIKALNWEVAHSHNGYLEILLDIGVIGFLVFILIFAKFFMSAIRIVSTYRNPVPLIIFIYLLIVNFSEKAFLISNDFHWIIFCINCMYINKMLISKGK